MKVIRNLVFLVLLVYTSDSFMCTSGDCSSRTIERWQWQIVGCTLIRAYSVVQGPQSGDYYIHGNCDCNSDNTAVTSRIKSDGTSIFITGYYGQSIIRTFALRNDESSIYFLISSPPNPNNLEILTLSANTGSNIHRVFTSLTSSSADLNSLLILNQANSFLFLGIHNAAGSKGSVCKYDFSNLNINCIEFTSVASIRSLAYLNDDELFYASIELTLAKKLVMQRIKFSDTSSLWTKTYACVGSGSCVIGMSASIVNSEFSKIYAFNSYSVTGLEYPQFLVLDSATGSSLLSTITFSLICSNIYKMKIYGTKIYSSAECVSRAFIIVYDTIESIYDFYSANMNANIRAYGIDFEQSSKRIIIVGINSSSYWYFIKTPITGISMHSDFQQYSYSPSIYVNSPYSTTSPVMTPTSETTYDNLTAQISPSLSLSLVSSFTVVGIASYNLETIELNVNPGQSYNLKLSLTCVFAASTAITYSMIPYGSSYQYPTFVSFDSASGNISFTVPESGFAPKYAFGISTTVPLESNAATTPVYLTVVIPSVCGVQNCSECDSSDSSKCKVCNSGYSVDSVDKKSCIAISSTTTSSIASVSSTETTTAQISSLTSIEFGACIVLILSSINLSSIAVVWTIFSQFRLLIFLILTDAYLPQSVIDYITGMKFFSFNFSFLSFQTISVVKKPLQLIEFDQSNSMLEYIGLNSGSTLVNSINLVATILMMFAFHATLGFDCQISCAVKNCNACNTGDANMLSASLTFLESCQLVLISATSEISFGNTKSASKIASLCLSVLILALLSVGWLAVFILWIKHARDKDASTEQSYFDEVFEGVKLKFCARGYTMFSTSRIFIFVIVMMFSTNIQRLAPGLTNIKIYELIVFQFLYLVSMLILRPMDRVEANLVLATNETIFFVLAVLLGYYNVRSRWDATIESIYLKAIMSNSIITAFIILVAFIVKMIKKCVKRCKSNQIEPNQIIPRKTVVVQVNIQNPESNSADNEENKSHMSHSNFSCIQFSKFSVNPSITSEPVPQTLHKR